MITVTQLDKKEWRQLSEKAHRVVFKEEKPEKWDRIDFALLTEDGAKGLRTYATCRELDYESLYWQYGGAFPSVRGTVATIKDMQAMIDWISLRYKRLSFLVENTNFPMLKMAIHFKFMITGVRIFRGKVLLEHALDLSGGI